MGADKPKVLCELHGKPLIKHLIENISADVSLPIGLVVGHQKELIEKTLGKKFSYYFQKQQLGTAHAVFCAKNSLIKEGVEKLIVLYGDHPFIRGASVKKLIDVQEKNKTPLCIMTTKITDFQDWRKSFFHWGRILRGRNGKIIAIREYKDCSKAERMVRELNPGLYCFQTNWLWKNIEKIRNKNAQKEYYLTDLIEMAINGGYPILSHFLTPKESLGINSFEEFEIAKTLCCDDSKKY